VLSVLKILAKLTKVYMDLLLKKLTSEPKAKKLKAYPSVFGSELNPVLGCR